MNSCQAVLQRNVILWQWPSHVNRQTVKVVACYIKIHKAWKTSKFSDIANWQVVEWQIQFLTTEQGLNYNSRATAYYDTKNNQKSTAIWNVDEVPWKEYQCMNVHASSEHKTLPVKEFTWVYNFDYLLKNEIAAKLVSTTFFIIRATLLRNVQVSNEPLAFPCFSGTNLY